MPVYCVTYDLHKAGQNYNELYREIRNSPGYWHELESIWLVSTSENAQQLSSRLLKHIDNNDHLLVIRVSQDFQGWLPKDAWEWLNNHIA
ncbi:hypothetical protein C1883_04965 [Pseudomonas protegens]|nr:hypothetical protein C1883_04965 [Pseudomonas protegens]